MEPREQMENLDALFVDHLVVELEKRPIGKILDFLSKYCGWEEIFGYVHEKVAEQRKKENPVGLTDWDAIRNYKMSLAEKALVDKLFTEMVDGNPDTYEDMSQPEFDHFRQVFEHGWKTAFIFIKANK